MASFQWKGVFPALLTPFDANDQVDLAMYEKNLDAQVDAGIHGIIIGGSLGEASSLVLDEKELLVKFSVKKLAGKLPVIMNIAEWLYQRSHSAGNPCQGMGCRWHHAAAPHALQGRR